MAIATLDTQNIQSFIAKLPQGKHQAADPFSTEGKLIKVSRHSNPDVTVPQWILVHISIHSTQLKLSVYYHVWMSK